MSGVLHRPPPDAHPRDLVAMACRALGTDEVVSWCIDLSSGSEAPDAPDLAWLGGTDDWPRYWSRVWGLRALLYVFQPRAEPAVLAALGDEHWRVREMAAKVCAKRELRDAAEVLDGLQDDANARVVAAAQRALRRILNASPDR